MIPNRRFRAARESSRHLHTAQILLSRSIPRAIIWLACSTHRRKADIPDMLTTLPHAWILDTVERRVIAMSIAGRENNELQKYRLTWF